jgi:molybdenum cofactor biosynthesis protein MoaC
MVDITFKQSSLRKAIAKAVVEVSAQSTIEALINNQVPKGQVFEMAKTAGLFAVKKTSDLIPDCHPLPVEYCAVHYDIKDLEIHIRMEVHTIYKTGVEVEAMHGVSVVALTMYDMLKPIDKGIVIRDISLQEKVGGKTDLQKDLQAELRAQVIVCSDTISAGKKEDQAGKNIMGLLEKFQVQVADYKIIPDEKEIIQEQIWQAVSNKVNLIILTGGTGLSPRDVTPEAVIPLLDRRLPGVEEAIRSYGQQRTAYAMLSRSVAGMISQTLVLALPGSSRGALESMQAIFPGILHIFQVNKGQRHE